MCKGCSEQVEQRLTELEQQRREDRERITELEQQRRKDQQRITELEQQRRKDQEHISELEQTIEQFTTELTEHTSRIEVQEQLEERVSSLEDDLDDRQEITFPAIEDGTDLPSRYDHIEDEDSRDNLASNIDRRTIYNMYVNGEPVLGLNELRKDIENVKEEVSSIDELVVNGADPRQTAEQSDLSPEDLPPLHNVYNTVTTLDRTDHTISKNQELGARCLPHLSERAHTNNGNLIVPSDKLRQILARDLNLDDLPTTWDVTDPNPNTIRRIRKFIASGLPFASEETNHGRSQLVIDRDAWIEYTHDVEGATIRLAGDYSVVSGQTATA